jgi:neutral ceramidase
MDESISRRDFVTAAAAAVLTLAAGWSCDAAQATPAAATVPVGVAKVDITPDGPIRLTGYASRKTESEGVALRLWAKALAIGDDAGDGPAVLMMVENCGVPGSLTAEVTRRLKAKAGVKPERFLVCSTHTHAGPWLIGFAPALLSEALPSEHRAHMEEYQRQLADKMEQTVLAALAARKPGRLAWAEGAVHFAMNRRPLKDGRCPGLGVNPAGPVDPSLPLLCATSAQGEVLAIVVNYACHCTTIGGDFNQIHGDWAGMAEQYIEAEHPGATALVCIGCGADANPEPRGQLEMAARHGRTVADEVNRLLKGDLTPLGPQLTARRLPLRLLLDAPPTREELQHRVIVGQQPAARPEEKMLATQAITLMAELDAHRPLPTSVDYSVTAWVFGDSLAMIFLPGEVVVDYALRLKRELDGKRLWITAYANDVPCYIVSRRVLREGGYEPDSSRIYYDKPSRLSAVVEDQIIGAAKSLVPASFMVKSEGQ